MNLTAFQFRKGHRRQMRKEGESLLYHLPLSRAIEVMNDEFGRQETLWAGRGYFTGVRAAGTAWPPHDPGVCKGLVLLKLLNFHFLHKWSFFM